MATDHVHPLLARFDKKATLIKRWHMCGWSANSQKELECNLILLYLLFSCNKWILNSLLCFFPLTPFHLNFHLLILYICTLPFLWIATVRNSNFYFSFISSKTKAACAILCWCLVLQSSMGCSEKISSITWGRVPWNHLSNQHCFKFYIILFESSLLFKPYFGIFERPYLFQNFRLFHYSIKGDIICCCTDGR